MGTSSPATQTEITFVVAKGALDGVVWQVAEEQALVACPPASVDVEAPERSSRGWWSYVCLASACPVLFVGFLAMLSEATGLLSVCSVVAAGLLLTWLKLERAKGIEAIMPVLVDSDGAVAEYYCTPCTPDRHNQLTGRKS